MLASLRSLWVGGAVLLAVLPAGAASPTFDCRKTDSEIEDLICKTDSLAKLDRELADVFKQAVASLTGTVDRKPAIAKLKEEQRGWVKGRNECWKGADKLQCTTDSYGMRIGELQARYDLAPSKPVVFYMCNGNTSDEIAATFYETRLPTVRLERGDTSVIGWLSPSGSGAKYFADPGITFWTKGEEAQVSWPEGTDFSCRVKK